MPNASQGKVVPAQRQAAGSPSASQSSGVPSRAGRRVQRLASSRSTRGWWTTVLPEWSLAKFDCVRSRRLPVYGQQSERRAARKFCLPSPSFRVLVCPIERPSPTRKDVGQQGFRQAPRFGWPTSPFDTIWTTAWSCAFRACTPSPVLLPRAVTRPCGSSWQPRQMPTGSLSCCCRRSWHAQLWPARRGALCRKIRRAKPPALDGGHCSSWCPLASEPSSVLCTQTRRREKLIDDGVGLRAVSLSRLPRLPVWERGLPPVQRPVRRGTPNSGRWQRARTGQVPHLRRNGHGGQCTAKLGGPARRHAKWNCLLHLFEPSLRCLRRFARSVSLH